MFSAAFTAEINKGVPEDIKASLEPLVRWIRSSPAAIVRTAMYIPFDRSRDSHPLRMAMGLYLRNSIPSDNPLQLCSARFRPSSRHDILVVEVALEDVRDGAYVQTDDEEDSAQEEDGEQKSAEDNEPQ